MNKIALTLGVLATAVAATASAATSYRTNDSTWSPVPVLDASQECWNARAGHFEGVRPGEYQGDLDFGRCRTIGYNSGYTAAPRYDSRYEPRYESRYDDRRAYDDRRVYRDSRQECWNPRARHYEEVRPGETQNDLDYSRCRVYR